MKAKRVIGACISAAAVLLSGAVAQAATQVYNLPLLTDLNNVPSNCSVSPVSVYNGCSGATGFHWTDTLAAAATINSVLVEFNYGVDCQLATQTLNTTFNSIAGATFLGTNYCNCSPRTFLKTFTPPASAYVKGGLNTWLISNPTTCTGFNANTNVGGTAATPNFARITVDYTLAAGGSDPWITPLPGAYPAGQAGNIVGNRLDAQMSTRSTQVSVDGVAATANTINGTANIIKTTLDATKVAVDASKVKIDANLDATVSSRATQVSLNLAHTKLDTILTKLGDLLSEQTRLAMEAALVAAGDNPAKPPQRIARFVLPSSQGGMLELVRTYVADGIAKAQAAGFDETSASAKLAQGDLAYTNGDWVGAFDAFRDAFQRIF